MFTGIIEQQLPITAIIDGVFTIQCPFVNELNIGQSIAHDGACMTITDIHEDGYSFFAMGESFEKTNFAKKKTGDTCNIERCLQVGARLDGHFVTGHIDTTATISKCVVADDRSLCIHLTYNSQRDPYVVQKGSITINGVSLTVVDVSAGGCSVRIIPHTQEVTNVGSLQEGNIVNIEYDLLAKYIHKQSSLS